MIYSLVHYPEVNTRSIDRLRLKYDPQIELIKPHITVMFPIHESVGAENLIHHVDRILAKWQAFPIHLQGFQISPDEHLYLLIKEGRTYLIRLYHEIYTGILADYLRKDVPFIPHLTLGLLNKGLHQYKSVLEEAKQPGIDHHCMLDKLHLVKVNDDRSKIVWSREFDLAK